MERERRAWAACAAAAVLGFLLGTALPELLRMGTGDYAGFLSLYSFGKLIRADPSPWLIFAEILPGRLEALLFLWMSGYTAAGLIFHGAYLFWLSSSAGMLIALFLLREGREGILLFFCCLFPQWLLYGAAWKQEYLWFLKERMPGGRNRAALPGSPMRELMSLGQMALLTVLGCAVESFLGLWTLNLYWQIVP